MTCFSLFTSVGPSGQARMKQDEPAVGVREGVAQNMSGARAYDISCPSFMLPAFHWLYEIGISALQAQPLWSRRQGARSPRPVVTFVQKELLAWVKLSFVCQSSTTKVEWFRRYSLRLFVSTFIIKGKIITT